MPLVVGLQRTGRLSAVLASYRDAAGLRTKIFVRYIGCRYKYLSLSYEGVHFLSHQCAKLHGKESARLAHCREVVERGMPLMLSPERRDTEQMSMVDKLQVCLPVVRSLST